MKTLGKTLFWLVLIVSVIVFILPFWFMLCNSFEEFSYVLPIPPHLVPSRISFAAYEHVLSQSDLPRAAYNSVVITLLTACFTVLIASLSAYGFARINFLGREVLFRIYLFTLMLPGFLGIIPQFLVLQGIGTAKNGLIGTKAGLILLYVGAGICGNTFFLRGHMAALPKELEEASYLDGCGTVRTFTKIMLAAATSTMVTVFLLSLAWQWTDTVFTPRFLDDIDIMSRNVNALMQSAGKPIEVANYVNIGAVLAVIPIALVYIVLQKFFVESIDRAGIVG